MPYHAVQDDDGVRIDFRAVYDRLIVPAITEAGMEPLRADEDPESRGIFQKSMFERLVVCEFALADLSTGNANVYYELGVRHALRPYSTVLIFREGYRLPLDVAHGSALSYPVGPNGEPEDVAGTTNRLVTRLRAARDARVDSPVHQLVTGLPVLEVDHERIDSFRMHADREEQLRRRLERARRTGLEDVRLVEADLGRTEDLALRPAIDLLVTYRSLSAWQDMTRVVRGLAKPVARVELVQQLFAWALNRAEEDAEAEAVLNDLLARRPSSETYGLLGRVYKDRWERARGAARRSGLLGRAIDAYVKGFESDWRDLYPGVNAVLLMSLSSPPHERMAELLPVVSWASRRRLARQDREPDYWDHATDLALGVLTGDRARAHKELECALAVVRDRFEPETTARDLSFVSEAMRAHGEDATWVEEIVEELRSEGP
ncbi:TRAFs-binding domain-containing protein [Geodermatophilus saharensis]|nr:TRAFs-binding domain-containing protein [Geodermatophilus saharensis]